MKYSVFKKGVVNIKVDKYNEFLRTKKIIDQQNQNQYPPGVQPDEYNRFLQINEMIEQPNRNIYIPSVQSDYSEQNESDGGCILFIIIIISFGLPRIRAFAALQGKPYFWLFAAVALIYTLTYNIVKHRIPSPIVFLFSLINFVASFATMNIILYNFHKGYPLSYLAHEFPILELLALIIETLIVFATIPFLQKIIWKVLKVQKK